MDTNDPEALEQQIQDLQSRLKQLEGQLRQVPTHWQASGYYTTYFATAGFFLGLFGATTSLLFNVVGSLFVGQHPLQLVKVYLTFPLGEKALTTQLDSGVTLAMGCCLYLATGMLLGVPFHLVLTRFTQNASFASRLVCASLLGLAIWVVNFYLILSWLQPLLFGGNWIVENIPWWVAASTHLVFGWTMALVYPLGLYTPYRPEVDLR